LVGAQLLGRIDRSSCRAALLVDHDVRLGYSPPDERATHHARLRLWAGVTAAAEDEGRARRVVQRGREVEPSREFGTRFSVYGLRTEHDNQVTSG
jgi:hypothetical protein